MALLTTDELAAHVELPEAVALDWINGAETAINMRYGQPGRDEVELMTVHGPLLALSHQPMAVVKVDELGKELDTTAYELVGAFLRRLPRGQKWRGQVEVTYTPVDDWHERRRVAIDLIKLVANNNPGVTSETIGSWSEAYNQQDQAYRREREAILDSLRPEFRGII